MSTVRTDLPQTAYYAHFLCIISVFLLLIPCALWSTHLAFYICTRCPWISWCLEKKNYCLLCQLCTTQLGWIYAFLLSTDWTCFSDAISSPSTYLSVGQSVIQSFRFGDSYRISELCELVSVLVPYCSCIMYSLIQLAMSNWSLVMHIFCSGLSPAVSRVMAISNRTGFKICQFWLYTVSLKSIYSGYCFH